MLIKQLLYSGLKLDIYVLEEDGVSRVSDFIEELPSAELSKVSHLIDVLKDHGPPCNDQKFRNEGNNIYALKTTNVRIYGFFDGKKSFVLAVGFLKNKQGGKKVERRHCVQAEELRNLLS
ncbi:MAG: type II toxin-antitoxin system RelE/ParE family toxin [Nitrospira sp.]